MNRRSFLLGTSSLVAVPVLPSFVVDDNDYELVDIPGAVWVRVPHHFPDDAAIASMVEYLKKNLKDGSRLIVEYQTEKFVGF